MTWPVAFLLVGIAWAVAWVVVVLIRAAMAVYPPPGQQPPHRLNLGPSRKD